MKALSPLLEGETILSGRASRSAKGLSFDKLRLANGEIEANIDGTYSSSKANLTYRASLKNLSKLAPDTNGAAELTGTIKGDARPFDLRTSLSVAEGQLVGRKAEEIAIIFEGKLDDNRLAGAVSSSGRFASKPFALNGGVDAGEASLRLQDLKGQVGSAQFNGDIERLGDGPISGSFDLDVADIGDLAALALTTAQGSVKGKIRLFEAGGVQAANANLKLANIRVQTANVGAANLVATVVDPFGIPQIGATVDGRDITASGLTINSLRGEIGTEGERSDFKLSANIDRYDADLSASGNVHQDSDKVLINLASLSINSTAADLRLRQASKMSISKGVVGIDTFDLAVGGGFVRIVGSIGDTLSLNYRMQSVSFVFCQSGAA